MNLRNIKGNPTRRTHKRRGAFIMEIELRSEGITKSLAERIYKNIHKILIETGALSVVDHDCKISRRRRSKR